ncbi:MAG TPA: CPBP family intramembrane glutamic endopeptidase [Flavobacteriaceae bacterium]|nr:CPBP family intramembrane glutamic endopeptidase [Flavobacteriaceae bacterium]
MYIEQAFRSLHEWWRYLAGALIAFLGSQLGAIPLMIVVAFKIYTVQGNMTDIRDQNTLLSILDPNLTLFLMLLSFAIGMGVLYLVVRFFHRQKFKTLTTARKKVDWRRIFFAFGIVAALNIVITGVAYFQNPNDFIVQFELAPFVGLFLIALVMIPIQTSFEEYLFRGYLMQGIGVNVGNRWLPLIITSVIFGGLHFFNPEVMKVGPVIMIYYIGTGFLLGIMTLMDEGMELALGYHAANNLIGAILVTADWTVFKTPSILKDISEPTAGADVLFPVFVIYPLILLLFSRKYKWSNWQEKLFGKVREPIVKKENDQ